MEIVERNSQNKYNGRNGWKPDIICCHIAEGTFNGAVQWLSNPVSQLSAHFVVAKDGRVTQLVPITDTAWCNGTSTTFSDNTFYGNSTLAAVRERKTNANYYTISIEHEGVFAEAGGKLAQPQLEATIQLIAFIRAEVSRIYNLEIPLDREHIVGHCQISPKVRPNCPGENYPFEAIINKLKNGNEEPKQADVCYRVQVGAFTKKANAVATVQRLNTKGYEGVVTEQGGFFKVQAGLFVDKANAEKMVGALKKDGFDTMIVTTEKKMPTAPKVKVGSKVRVKQGAKTFTGGNIAQFVYNNIYVVDELVNERAVLDLKGICTPVNVADLIIV